MNKILLHLCLKAKLLMESLVKLVILVVQPLHLLNLSSEERSNGFLMLKILRTGEFNKWKLQMPESHTLQH
jgi:hypothetical protein